MPIDKRAGESKDSFISRCMSIEVGAGKDQDQAYAICESKWSESFNEAPVNTDFKKVKKVIFSEDFDEETVKSYKDKGFKVYILSKRKIRKSDKKTINKLKKLSLSEDDVMLYGEPEALHSKYKFDEAHLDSDPMLSMLSLVGKKHDSKRVFMSKEVQSIDEAIEFTNEVINMGELRFLRVETVFTYEVRPGVEPAISGSRPFCSKLMSSGKEYTLDEIRNLPTSHLVEMGLPADVLAYRGGFYREPGEGGVTTPFCRHYWKANVKVVN